MFSYEGKKRLLLIFELHATEGQELCLALTLPQENFELYDM